jgi:drug/metabolite transporter (DMT)-like permease
MVTSRPRLPTRESVAILLLVLVTAAWGSTFILVKQVTEEMSVMSFLALRFWIASATLLLLRPRALLNLNRRTLWRGLALGAALSGGYVLQTLGLRYTSAALSGFLTGLCVVMTPLLAWPLLGHRSPPATNIAVVLAAAGLGALSLRGITFGLGEWLSLGCALCYALQIVGLGAWSEGEDAITLALLQLASVAVVCTVGSLPRPISLPQDTFQWFGVLSTSILATSLAFVVQAWAQTFISPTRAAIIFTLEPVFAGLVAWLGGEHLSVGVVLGGVLVVVAMLIAEWGIHREVSSTRS